MVQDLALQRCCRRRKRRRRPDRFGRRRWRGRRYRGRRVGGQDRCSGCGGHDLDDPRCRRRRGNDDHHLGRGRHRRGCGRRYAGGSERWHRSRWRNVSTEEATSLTSSTALAPGAGPPPEPAPPKQGQPPTRTIKAARPTSPQISLRPPQRGRDRSPQALSLPLQDHHRSPATPDASCRAVRNASGV